MRAERLGVRGLLEWLDPGELSPAALVDGVERVADVPRHELAGRIGSIEHRGIAAAVQHLASMLEAGRPAASGLDRPGTGAVARAKR